MAAAAELLEELDVDPEIARASAAVLARLAADPTQTRPLE